MNNRLISMGEPVDRTSANVLDTMTLRFYLKDAARTGKPFLLSDLYRRLGRRFQPVKDVPGRLKSIVYGSGYRMSRKRANGVKAPAPSDWEIIIHARD